MRYGARPMMVSFTRSIFDGEPLADFVNALVQCIEPRVNGAVVEIEDVSTGEEREYPMMMLDIAKNRLDRLADECDHAPHKFHCIPPGRLCRRPPEISAPDGPLPEPSMAPLLRVADRSTMAAKLIAAAAKLCEISSVRMTRS